MRKLRHTLVLAGGLLLPLMAAAQGTLQVSNLDETPGGSAAIGSDWWVAQTIHTGGNPHGYVLNSLRLRMDDASGAPSGFSVSLYSKTGAPDGYYHYDSPQNSLGSLSGSEPATSGIFTYTTPGILLSASTWYYVVVTATTPVADGAYTWSAVNDEWTESNGFRISNHYCGSADGSSWTWYPRREVFQLGVFATAVPEPTTGALLGLGLAVLGYRCWRWNCR